MCGAVSLRGVCRSRKPDTCDVTRMPKNRLPQICQAVFGVAGRQVLGPPNVCTPRAVCSCFLQATAASTMDAKLTARCLLQGPAAGGRCMLLLERSYMAMLRVLLLLSTGSGSDKLTAATPTSLKHITDITESPLPNHYASSPNSPLVHPSAVLCRWHCPGTAALSL